MNDKIGRPRTYRFKSLADGIRDEVDVFIDSLNELAERVYDQIEDLSLDALNFEPADSYLSIAKLFMHMASSDVRWVGRLSGAEPSEDLVADITGMTNVGMKERFTTDIPATRLIESCRRIRGGYTIPMLRDISDIDTPTGLQNGPYTIREVLMHLCWHWTYHSGHIGLTRLLWGSDYQWTFA